MVPDKGCFV